MDLTRKSGLLLHPTSLPGPFGMGDLGPAAYQFVRDLQQAAQRVWQVLPLQPPDCHGSPYAASSAFAGDPMLVSVEVLRDEGLLEPRDFDGLPTFPEGRVSYEACAVRAQLLGRAFAAFRAQAGERERIELQQFREENAFWLEDHALFVALRDAYGAPYWERWPEPLRRHVPHALVQARREHEHAVDAEVFRQWLFHRQWARLRSFAHGLGVEVFGDVPIFVARDSSDVWARPELFFVDDQGTPSVVAGVPPDLFSETGQLWGNPLFDWAIHGRGGYAWWIERVRHALSLVDILRIDHFRGFAGYWEIPHGAETAVDGRWVPGPGMSFFRALQAALGDLPIVAEDLGLITEDVTELLAETGFPGMKVLQFAFDGDADNPFVPERHDERSVVYTGTHDNDTTAGWLAGEPAAVRARVLERTGPEDPVWGMVELAFASPGFLAVVPVQDVLGLGNDARMNLPGTKSDKNWSWRLRPGQLELVALERLRELTVRHGRAPAATI
ncbi:MAG: 4-alpha-glucanotransferase [Planctomycetes bacterium]|nr:4-alpha-glucanotransferase [Planctomycetota bacterium]